ncbi:L,D-transpeptidase [Microvirga flavescens]|uniref:L,D-transpeptidase n=1 Tax=Microvirga flavescens TaxID=2249811 RepID=UPI000DDC032A|nr:L,D-transpeptidase [Microvirga flavescens]
MGRTRAALYGLACAVVALATPAAAFTEIDPLTRQPLYSGEESFQAQAAPIPREIVAYDGRYAPGTIVVSTSDRRLYYVLGNGQAVRYGVGVGRPGFTWGGAHSVTMKREWPDWRPPAQMLKRRPDLPRYMTGGPENPLGARALYIGSTIYRIHGSNEPDTIGQAVSSGCIRMTNDDVIDLYNRAKVGARVVVQR